MEAPQRVLTIFGTRPEAIKLFPLLHCLDKDPRFESRICVTGQHREMLDQVLQIAGIAPDHDLNLMQHDQSLDELTAGLLTAIGRVIDAERPDWVVVQGDTTTAMCGAVAAHYRKLPVAHVEAGLRSGNAFHPWPEETNRKIIAAIARLHFAPTEAAMEALRRENVDHAGIFLTGNTVVDALHWMKRRIEVRPQFAPALAPLEASFAGRRILGVTCHRRESLGDGMRSIAAAICELARRDDLAVVFPLHLNPRVRKVMEGELSGLANVALLPPLDYPDFVYLLSRAHIMLTDSGGVQEEAPAFGKPVLVMRETTERTEGLEAGTALLVGTDTQRIVSEVNRLLDDGEAYAAMANAHNPYGDGQSAPRITDLLAQFRQIERPAV